MWKYIIQNNYDFGPTVPPLCETATGIKTFSVSGSVPPGLSYSTYFPEPLETTS